ncbi:TPA: Lrp/AsnC family transcriptional regulator [Candidatus Woesearchaeota archaeon]|nr:Lrp/AsnC family transcriptional regulator [Candidatus Woesearchaeota archaeon]
MLKLDKYDKKLLYELDKKANLPLSVLASKLHRSKQVILYRMKKLEEDGIITGYHAIVDMAKLGYFSFRIYLRFHQTTEEEEKQFVAFVKKNYAQVWTITRMHGKWDFALFLGVKNIMEFHTIWDGVLLQYKPKIKNYNVAVYAPVYNFNRSFFIDTQEQRSVRIYGEGAPEDYDELDWKIIQEYAPNVRSSALEVGKKLGIAADTVRNRIKKLEQRKIITGYKLGLGVNKLGYTSYRIDLELISTQENPRLFEFCKQHKNIYQINKSIGGANFELEVMVTGLQELLQIIEEIKRTFKGIIDDVDYFSFSTFHILNYIPD